MKKMLPLLVVVIITLNGFGASAISFDVINADGIDTIIFDDELDQSQTQYEGVEGVGYIEGIQLSLCQSFTPQKEILTRVFLYALRQITPNPFQLAIRSELNGGDLTTVSVSYTAFPISEPAWVEFDFEDISVTVGETYYMIMSTPKKVGHFYLVGGGEHNQYPSGSGYYRIDEQEWVEVEDVDFCFKTYGRNHPLQIVANGGLGKVGATITNNFGYVLENIQWWISVQGGFLNRISEENSGVIDALEDSKAEYISIDSFIIGLGPIEITISVELETGEKIIRNAKGFALLFFIFA